MTAYKSNSFPKDVRLRSAADFRRVYDAGAKRVSGSFVVFALPNGLDFSRFGLTTPRKLGKAHERNRIKRILREILRSSNSKIPSGFDFVVNPRRAARDWKRNSPREELLALLGAEE